MMQSLNLQTASELVGIARLFAVFERDAVCGGDVTVAQCFALQELLGGPLDNSTLASRASCSVSAMTRLVDGLERKGWVRRTRSKADRRHVAVALTGAGRARAESLVAHTNAAVAAILAQIPAARHAAILEALRELREAMERAGETICSWPA